jgi:hypothetical protein
MGKVEQDIKADETKTQLQEGTKYRSCGIKV